MGHNNGFLEGYADNGERERFGNRIITPGCDEGPGFIEGYVDSGERVIEPFNPAPCNIEEIIIIPPSKGGVLFVQYVSSINVTTADGDILTPETFSFEPLATSDIYITINGLCVFPANGSSEVSISAFYITDTTNTIVRTQGTYKIGDVLHWNGSVANYEIEANDQLKIIYEI
jgi:hypothetical protein